ncbi:MAG TPA: indolepyruvate/phenylpyruvate decarboxylase [Beijerinckiaceae bacterium]|nr:indolepyruvate/phenylpyruvate decarboxylase [Beijerinckiaceae bacterium]
MKLAVALAEALKARGAAEIFGLPGDFALPLFRELEEAGTLPIHTLSHEPGLGFAADAAARLRGTLACAVVTYGAGALNIVNAVAQAYAEKSPLVIVSGAPAKAQRAMGLGLHHQVKHFDSQLAIFRELTAAQAVLDNPETAAAEIARVLDVAINLSRPVYIEFPRDMVAAEVAPVPLFRPAVTDPAAAAAAADEIMARLKSAKRPALLLCVEVRRYGLEAKVEELARRLAIPAATTFMARGLLPGSEAPLIGTYLGLAGRAEVREIVEGADCLLMLGVILCDTNFGVSERLIDMRTSIHAFDREVRFGHHVYPEIGLPALVDALLERARPLGAARRKKRVDYPHGLIEDATPLVPDDVSTAVNDLFKAVGHTMPIASDMGDCLFAAMEIVHTPLVAPAYYATMGPGVPMGLGLEIAGAGRPLIMVGDGAFQMTGWELGNARRLGLKPIVLLFNNTSWGMLKAFQSQAAYNDLDDWRFAEMAAPLGGVGVRVTTRAELANALREAYADKGHWRMIEIMLPRGVFSKTLRRFTEVIGARAAGTPNNAK